MKFTLSEQKYLNFAKLLILGLVIILIVSPGKSQHWPFIYWSLYDRGNPKIPQKTGRAELRVLDTHQNWHSIKLMDLYSIDDDSSRQGGGTEIFTKNFLNKNSKNLPSYRFYLLQYLEEKLKVEIDLVEAYILEWNLNYEKFPPLDINKPSKITKIDSFEAKDYVNYKEH